MADEQSNQAADPQPDPQPQPAAEPEAGAQAAPETQPEEQPAEQAAPRMVGRITHPDGSVVDLDEEGNEHPVEAQAEEQPAAEAQADGTPEAVDAEPAEPDALAQARANLEAAQANLARQEFLSRQPTASFVPRPQPVQAPEFPQVDLSDMPNFKDEKFENDQQAAEAVSEWLNRKSAEMKHAAEQHAYTVIGLQQQVLQQQAEQAQAYSHQQAERQRAMATVQEAHRRSGLSVPEFQAKMAEIRQESLPPWYAGESTDALPVNYAARVMDATIQARHEAGVPLDRHATSADFVSELVATPGLARAISGAFPKSQSGLAVLHALASGPNAVGRLKALTTTDDGRKAMAELVNRPTPQSQTAFEHWVGHVNEVASRFDGTPTPPPTTPANATNTPATTTVTRPTAAPPAVTPNLRGGVTTAQTAAEPVPGTPEWERAIYAEIEEHARRTGSAPQVL